MLNDKHSDWLRASAFNCKELIRRTSHFQRLAEIDQLFGILGLHNPVDRYVFERLLQGWGQPGCSGLYCVTGDALAAVIGSTRGRVVESLIRLKAADLVDWTLGGGGDGRRSGPVRYFQIGDRGARWVVTQIHEREM